MPRFILSVLAVLAAFPAGACGPAAHAYIAMRALGIESGPALMAAALPDFNGAFHFLPGAEGRIKYLTHYEFDRMAPSDCATGFATHNGEWGADSFAHAYLRDATGSGYFTAKIRELSERCDITMNEAEDLFDGAVEIALAQQVGPSLGRALTASARAAGRAEEDAVVEAFAAPLAETTTLTEAEAESCLRWAHRAFKSVMTAYGVLLQQDAVYQKPIAIRVIGLQFGWSPKAARERLDVAFLLATDCRPALDVIAASIAEHCKSR